MIRLSPELKHPFHVALASPDWVRGLETLISERIRSLGGFETQEGEGVVTSRYGEDRFMGPNSLCKYNFDVVVKMKRLAAPGEFDEYRAVAAYDPERRSFSAEGESRSITRLKKAVRELVDRLAEKVLRGCQAAEIEAASCPWCLGPVEISFHPQGLKFALACKANSQHFWQVRDAPTRPDWWQEKALARWTTLR